MAIREINYTVTSGGIEPATLQFGGVQGEQNATLLRFNIDDVLWKRLQQRKEQFEGSQLIYRFDGVDGVGNVHPSDVTVLLEQSLVYFLPYCVTEHGGKVKVTLVITLYKNSASEMELYSGSANLQLRPKSSCAEHKEKESISALAYGAKESLAQAEAAAERAEYAEAQTKDAATILEEGSEVVFVGGDASSGSEVLFKVDGAVINGSPNPVSGGAVYKAVKEVEGKIADNNDELQAYADNAANGVKNEMQELINNANSYKFGSYEVTGDKFVPHDSNKALGSNIWNYIIFNNEFYICWGHFNIKPTESSGNSNDIYVSEEITVPLPFEVYINGSTVTAASSNLTEISNPCVYKKTLTFKYRRCNAPVSLEATRTYLQIMGIKPKESETNE